jgi:hypothetical protein
MTTPFARIVRRYLARHYGVAVGRILRRFPPPVPPDLSGRALVYYAGTAATYLERRGREAYRDVLVQPTELRRWELAARVHAGVSRAIPELEIDGLVGDLPAEVIPLNARLDVLATRMVRAVAAWSTEECDLPVAMAAHVERWLESDAQE